MLNWAAAIQALSCNASAYCNAKEMYQLSITGYIRLPETTGAVEVSGAKAGMLQQQYDNIQKEMKETGTFSSALETGCWPNNSR